MEKNLVSVIIPTYNRGYCIKYSVESVLNQTYSNIECIIVDDGSTDDTKKIIESIVDNRIRYIYLSDNGGPSRARNIGVELARGKYIAFNDSDDIWYACKLEEQMYKFCNMANFGMVYCDYLYKGAQKEVIMPPNIYDISELEGDIFQSLLNDNKIGTPTILVKKECIQDVGGFNENLKSLEDWEFVLRIANKYSIGYIHEPLIRAQYSTDGVNSNIRAQLDTLVYLIKKYHGQSVSLKSMKKIFFDKLSLIDDVQCVEVVKQEIASVIENEEFDCLMEYAVQVRKLQKVRQLLADFSKPDSVKQFVDRNIEKDTEIIAVYGAGVAGISTAYNLIRQGCRVEYLIDQSEKNQLEFQVVKPENLSKDVTMIVSSILSEDIDSIQELYHREIKVLNIFDILKY